MSTLLYDTGRNAFLTPNATGGQIDWLGNNIKAALIHTNIGTSGPANPYIFNATHTFWSQVTAFSGAVVATSGNLSSKTAVAGVAGCADIVFTAVPASPATHVDAVIIYKDTGTATTSLLIAFIDNASGLPVVPNSSDITLVIDTGANKLFKL